MLESVVMTELWCAGLNIRNAVSPDSHRLVLSFHTTDCQMSTDISRFTLHL